jgi:hypothetical protein
MRLLDAVELIALLVAHRLHMTRDQLAFKHVTFEFHDVADADAIGAAQAFHVDIDVRAGAIFEKAVALRRIKPLHRCTHNYRQLGYESRNGNCFFDFIASV